MTQEAPEQNVNPTGVQDAATKKASDPYADFWMRGLGAVLEALVFMALSIPVAFGLPFMITRVDASIICPEIPGFFFFEGFAPSVAFPLFAMKAQQHFTAQSRIGPTEDTTMIWALVIGGLVIGNLLYHVIMESSPLQGTIGKAVIGMKVTKVDGSRPSVINVFVRHMARMLSMLPVFGGYLMILKTAKKQALHDKLSGCVVVKVQPEIPPV
jgi:uncharacterized RDD family membrane protein YckC